jgi:predicted RNA-binding Zn-ribbon protein involved in translation (DUF1610 family)
MFKTRLKKLVANFVASVAEEAVDATFDYAVEVAKNRAARPETAPLEACEHQPARMVSRYSCPDCAKTMVYRATNGDRLAYLYECTNCARTEALSKREAANREGFPL